MSELEAPDRRAKNRNLFAIRERSPSSIADIGVRTTESARTQDRIGFPARLRLMTRTARHAVQRMAQEEAQYGRAVLFAPVYMGAGAIIWFELDTDPPLAAISAAFAISVAALLLRREAGPVARHLLLAAALLLFGMLLAQWQTWRAATVMLDTPVTTTVTGRIEEREADARGRWRYVLKLQSTQAPALGRAPGMVTAFVRGQEQPFELGDIIQGRARLTPPAGPALPGLHDFAFGAFFDGIGANGYFYGLPKLMSPAGDATDDGSFIGRADIWLTKFRSGIGDRIRTILPGDTGAFAASLVTDERRAISDETTEALRVSGLADIIAISGLNMALSAGIFYVGLRYLFSLFPGAAQAWPTKKIAAFGALVTVTAYYMISGFGVSAERAFVMMAIMLVAVLFDRPSLSLRNVALSAIAILILSPSEALGPSFQMSFAATLALVSGYSLWQRRPSREGGLLRLRIFSPLAVVFRFFGGIASTSFVGGLSTAIFSIEHFHRLATYGLVANLAAMPVVSFVVMPVGMLAVLLMPFGLDYYPWQVTGVGLDAVTAIAKTVAAWGGNIPFARLPLWLFPTIVAGFLLMTMLRTKLRHAGAVLIAASIAIAALTPETPKTEVLISEDGELVALLRNGKLEPNRERPPDFIFGQWQQALALFDQQPPKMLPADDTTPTRKAKTGPPLRLDFNQQKILRDAMAAALDTVPEGGFACHRKDWCAAILDNGRILLTIDNAAYLGPACDIADLVVIPVRLRLNICRSGAQLFTGATLRRSGSVEIDLASEKPEIITAFQGVQRAWNRHRAYDWRSNTFVTSRDISSLSDSDG
ncbi:ComEC family competence protein [Neorhizobium sp. P12A]|nr:ComEC family competence protein [Neorhizobium sp. P12A]